MKTKFKVGDIIKCLWFTGIYKIVNIKKDLTTAGLVKPPENIFILNKVLHENGNPCKSRIEKSCFEYALKPIDKYIKEKQIELNIMKENINYLI
jgi:hypothetical protein